MAGFIFWDWEGDDEKICGNHIKKEYCLYTENKMMINKITNNYTICNNRNYNKDYKKENKCKYSDFHLTCFV